MNHFHEHLTKSTKFKYPESYQFEKGKNCRLNGIKYKCSKHETYCTDCLKRMKNSSARIVEQELTEEEKYWNVWKPSIKNENKRPIKPIIKLLNKNEKCIQTIDKVLIDSSNGTDHFTNELILNSTNTKITLNSNNNSDSHTLIDKKQPNYKEYNYENINIVRGQLTFSLAATKYDSKHPTIFESITEEAKEDDELQEETKKLFIKNSKIILIMNDSNFRKKFYSLCSKLSNFSYYKITNKVNKSACTKNCPMSGISVIKKFNNVPIISNRLE